MNSFLEEFGKNRAMRTMKDGIVNYLQRLTPDALESMAASGISILPSVESDLLAKYGSAVAKQCKQALPFLLVIDDKDLETIFAGVTAYSVRHREVLERHKAWTMQQLQALHGKMVQYGQSG